MEKVKVTLTRSAIARPAKFRRVLDSLGLKKIGSSRVFDVNPSVLGMLEKVQHIVRIERNV